MGTFRVGIESKLKPSNMFAYGRVISLHINLVVSEELK